MKKKDRKFTPFLLLFLSVAVFSLTIYAISGNRYEAFYELWNRWLNGKEVHNEVYISSYLSHTTRVGALRDAFLLLEDEKRMLSEVQRMMGELEGERAFYLKKTVQQSEVYETNISLFSFEEILGDLRAAGYLERYRAHFTDDLNRRTRVFFEGYERRLSTLQRQGDHHKGRIEELSHFIAQVARGKVPYAPVPEGSWILTETEERHLQRALFYIEQGDYRQAGQVMGEIAEKNPVENEIPYYLWSVILQTLDEIQQRVEGLSADDHFIEVKMSYLAENYEETLSDSGGLADNEFLKPLLNSLTDAALQNIMIEKEIAEAIDLKKDMSRLVTRAGELEERGEYARAGELYRKLLIFDLPPHDREHIIGRLYICVIKSSLNSVKRRDNTKAIKLLDDARNLAWKGKRDEAIELYKKLILDYPNSDYVEQALDELADLLS
jgi:tetratricopeptide (TPR) repeat protein